MKSLPERILKAIDGAVNLTALMAVLVLTSYAAYALWDSKQIYLAADKSSYTAYKPVEENEGKSFKELQAINPEVIAWLNVYGTNIDYPVAQGKDNTKYINTDAEGRYSYSGAIFLDCENNKDFSDFNNILYGHHMEKKAMFGEVGSFSDIDVFEKYRYGNLYYSEKDHGIEFFAFIHTDAYDERFFIAGVAGKHRQVYLDSLLEKAMHKRDIGVTIDDRIVMLITCSPGSTNGRDILAGRVTDEVFAA